MKKNVQIIIGVVIFGLCYGLYDFYEFSTVEFIQMQELEKGAVQKIASLEDESQRLQNFARNIEGIKQESKELNLQLEAVLEHMPRTFNLAALLRKLTMLAQNSGIEILEFRPKRDVASQVASKGSTLFYETILVEFKVKGAFTQTLVFFDQLARLKRIVNVESLKITTPTSERVPGVSTIVASSDVVIKTYRFTE